ncbi:hypothetical protein PACTADRAFT_37545 [Pachysolen tannophilus NRRL Y-2460]|uniref:enoyl-[acyl-carrier-protein] reductase n=1 Tax=Pachysolen tannophilus NRRL Y-2460 TaxID=669874 RepID=A0A1E4U2J4_PACTA|nr:hypothetical protein PACTADRAFT_37545 [Pachysolen tannophilus NRRL Y-2460]
MVTSRAIVYSQYGEPSEMIKLYKYNIPDPSENEVLLQSLAHPINPSDLNQIEGVYPSRPELTKELGTNDPSAVGGNEGLFKVIGIGSSVTGFKIDDWCIPKNVNFGTWRSHAKTTENLLVKIPNTKISKTQAATLSVNTSTAYEMLTTIVNLKPGDWMIQNGGNSSVGKDVIQIAKKLGINTINVVRDRPTIEELKQKLYSLGATKVITEEENNSKEFSKTIKDWTKGSQVKLALNCVGGSSSTGIARKLSPNGVIATYGGMSKKPVNLPTSLFIFKNIKAVGFWITANSNNNPQQKLDTINQVLKFIQEGDIADFETDKKIIQLNTASDEEFLQSYKNAINDSKKSKQLIFYE